MTRLLPIATIIFLAASVSVRAEGKDDVAFFERKIRPLLIKRCYECHSEQAGAAEGGLLLDRRSGWLDGGETGKAVLPGEPDSSLLIKAVKRTDDLKMPPDDKLSETEIALLVAWVRRGAPGPRNDLGATEFSRLGDQNYLFEKARDHWAFQPVKAVEPPQAANPAWNRNPVDRFVFAGLKVKDLSPSKPADARTLVRRVTFDVTGLPPTTDEVSTFITAAETDREQAVNDLIDRLLQSSAYGEHIGRLWLDVARYADTDSFYRPDTRTPHYFPFAFTYRDYVIRSFNEDKPYNQFLQEQLAVDLLSPEPDPANVPALGFLAVGPYANRDPLEALDDWIDVTTRGLMGITAACARCHDHKYEPVPTADYYSLRGIFASVVRLKPLDENRLPVVPGYAPAESDKADYEQKRAAIDKKIAGAGSKKSKNNNRSVAVKIRETELAQLLLQHPGAPAHAMVVLEKRRPVAQQIYIRGDRTNRGPAAPRRFLKVLDSEQQAFPEDSSGRLELAKKITDPQNPLTARVFVNRVWGYIMGSHLVETPSDFGLQGARPSHPELLEWLADDFIRHGWSSKHLIRTIVGSQTYQQHSRNREEAAVVDPSNRLLWRANRKHLSIEAIRDGLLAVSGQLDRTPRGRAGDLWGEEYTRRRTVYGYINRFNLDPTLRAFDFPTPMQSQPARGETIVAPQALFTMNSPFVIDQAGEIVESQAFENCADDAARIGLLFNRIYQRNPQPRETERIERFLYQQAKFAASKKTASRWQVLAQALMMSNEFQYLD